VTDAAPTAPADRPDPSSPTREPAPTAVATTSPAPVETGAAAPDRSESLVPVASPIGVGPFSVREVVLGGVWFLAFVISFLPYLPPLPYPIWAVGLDWVLTVAVPTVAVGLLALRRLSPGAIRRVGSLGLDQFASVAFSISLVAWLAQLWNAAAVVRTYGGAPFAPVIWIEIVLALAGVALTVAAPLIPFARDDFRGRERADAHPAAAPVRPVAPRPARVAVVARSVATAETAAPVVASPTVAPAVGVAAPEPTPNTVRTGQPFWALLPDERTVVDAEGAPVFTIGPAAWALVIEDRDGVFVVRHDDGRVGFLHESAGAVRG